VHYIAPIPIIFGIIGAIVGLLWLVAAGSEEDGGPSQGMFFAFGIWYLLLRVMKQLFNEPMSVLPAFGILVVSAGLIWLGIAML
jgi:hypothetical protein